MGERPVLYVDVDGTLINYHGKPRLDVVDAVVAAFYLGFHVVVWSGGGREYADMWALRLFRDDIIHVEAMAKDFSEPGKKDVVVDDMPVVTEAMSLLPEEFVKYMKFAERVIQ